MCLPNESRPKGKLLRILRKQVKWITKKTGTDDEFAALIESEASPKEFQKNWARLHLKFISKPTFRKIQPKANLPEADSIWP